MGWRSSGMKARSLHLALYDMADAELRLTGADDLAFAALKAEYADSDVLGGAPPGLG